MSALDDLKETMARLRGPDGCPWDREQTHKSLARCLVEECAELLDTIDREDMDHMREELGDVLLQVVFHAQMAEEQGLFTLDEVASEINEKLIRRHPHVFGEARAADSAEVLTQWEAIKAEEKQNAGASAAARVFKHLPPALPALLYASEAVKQAGKQELLEAMTAEPLSLQNASRDLDEEKAGRLLFEAAGACQLAGIDPESALRRHVSKLIEEVEQTTQGRAVE